MTHTQKDLLDMQNILSNIETMKTAINYFLVNTILGHFDTLTSITFSYKKVTVTFIVYQQTF